MELWLSIGASWQPIIRIYEGLCKFWQLLPACCWLYVQSSFQPELAPHGRYNRGTIWDVLITICKPGRVILRAMFVNLQELAKRYENLRFRVCFSFILYLQKSSLLSKFLPLYYHRERAFESSRQEFPCSAPPQQGKRRRKKKTTISCFCPAEEDQSRGFLVGTFKCTRMTVIKRQDRT